MSEPETPKQPIEKKPYEAPKIEIEESFEVLSAGCSKQAVGFGCDPASFQNS